MERRSTTRDDRERDVLSKYEESQLENNADVGRMASKLRAEAQLASSLFAGEDIRKASRNQIVEKSKQISSKKHEALNRYNVSLAKLA